MTSQAKQASTAQLSSPPFYKASRDSQGNRASPEPALPSLVTELHTARTPSTAFRLNRGLPDFQWSGASFDTDRETCHAAFVKVLQGISSFREKVQAAAEGRSQDPLVQQILSLADALENETKAALAGAGFDEMPAHFPPSSQVVPSLAYRGTSPERSYESMRQALQEMQKRSDNLLARIHKESEANLELSKARTGAEETSRKLSEQVTQQTEELNKLVGQRLKAEQQLEDVRQRSRIEAELREEDFQRKLAAAHKEADERCHAMQKGLVDKLHLTQRAMEKVKTDFHRLRADHADSRKAVLILNEAMSQLMGQTERNISQRVEALVKSSIEQRVLASDVNRELESLELRVLAEQELRSNEVASLRQRYSALEQERDQLQATFTNDVARLSLQLEDDQRRKLEESEKLKAEELRSEAKQQAFTEEAQELLRCRDIIERMKLLDTKQTEALSSQEQELLKCRDLIQHLKSESAEQSAATFRQQQELDCLRVEIVEKQTAARGLAEEHEELRLCEQKLSLVCAEKSEELQDFRAAIEQMKSTNLEKTAVASSQEQELLKCRDLIQHLKSESAEQSAATFRQQQELDCLRVEIVEKQTAARGLAEERDQLLATEAMQLVVISQRAEELQKCRDDLERLKSEGMEYSAMTGQQAQEILHQKKEIQRLHGELTLKEAVVARFEEARTDLALSENQRHLLLEQRRASSKGLNALHMQLESHILRLQKHSDELRGEFRR